MRNLRTASRRLLHNARCIR